MANSDNLDFRKTQPSNSPIKAKEDFWELDDDWDDGASAKPAETPRVDDVVKPPKIAPVAKSAKKSDSTSKSEKTSFTSGLSLFEKITLTVLASALLGLGIYSYAWLYKKNQIGDDQIHNLPIQGEFINISDFSTYWKDGTGKTTGVLPVVSISINQDAKSTGALRIYFRNTNGEDMGDPITLSVENGRFVTSESSKISVTGGGSTIEVVSSHGLDQEGDFSAYVLEKHLAWRVFIFEAAGSSASWQEFAANEILSVKISPERK